MTLRGIDPALRSALEAQAAKLGMSLNAVILQVLRSSLGLARAVEISHDLDALAGAWSRDEAQEFAAAIREFEEIDPSLWQPRPDAP